MGAKQKPVTETKAYQRKQDAIKKRALRQRALQQERAIGKQAQAHAIEAIATEAFGPGGLTPERRDALATVVAGPEQSLAISSPNHLRHLIRKARQTFTEKAEDYMTAHLQSVQGALAEKQFDVAARHAEWALDAFGDAEERVIERVAPSAGSGGPAQVMVGVNLGGMRKP